MTKSHKYQKQLKSEKAKVKLKIKGLKQLPKGLNITDTDFKVKKILIREQLKHQDTTQILSRRKLNTKDLLIRLQHYNSSVRQDAIKELKDILSQHKVNTLNVQLNELLKGISALILDKEKRIRRESLKALNFILSSISKDQLIPFCNILISYLTCAMTHINQNIMEDSLLFLDILIQYCDSFLASNSHKIFSYFLDMISKLHLKVRPDRQLTLNLNSKNTSIKWRIRVLSSLEHFMLSIVHNKKSKKLNSSTFFSKIYHVKDEASYFSIYSSNCLKTCLINLQNINFHNKINKSLDLTSLQNYIDSLMPLMFDSWLEVCPKRHGFINTQLTISDEAATLLKCITNIIQSVIEYIEILEKEIGTSLSSTWFKAKFQNSFIKILLNEFPYMQKSCDSRITKYQEKFIKNSSGDCLEQNLTLCYIYIWFTTMQGNTKIDTFDKHTSSLILQFIIGKLENWTNNQEFALPYLIKVLKLLFIQANIVWYKNKVPLGNILKTIINTYLHQTKEDLQIQLFMILTDIVMNLNLEYLHSEDAFKQFVKSLPALLLEQSIHENTIQMLNKVVLQYRQWIQKELEENRDAIIENAKTIQIIGSGDERSSRLMICNLFYFMNEQVYY